MSKHPDRVLILGGGGVTGLAWMAGLIAGMARAGHDFSRYDKVLGTSAGAAVGAQLCAGWGADELLAAQLDPARQSPEIKPRLPLGLFLRHALPIIRARHDKPEQLRRIGRMALAAQTVPAQRRRAVIAARLPSEDWPARFACTAVAADTGELVTFDITSGVGLVDAVAASCAVPGIWPPVEIGGRRYIDGGVRDGENADLAMGAREVTILSPMTRKAPGARLASVIAALETAGARVRLIKPDAPAQRAMGRNALDPAKRAASAEAGRDQGLGLA